RPAVWSLPPEEAARQARDLVAAGFREVVLCGIHLGLYGADLEPQVHLADLAERLLAVEGLGRLRLSSIEPMEVDPWLLGVMASEPERLCPHLHVPLQSGDDGVLAAMGRPYTAAEFLAKAAEIRAALPLPAVTTDVLVGFPGESDAAFAGTLRVAREAGLARMHVFPFSRRAGTPAADMPGQVPRDVARARRAAASALGDELARAYRAGFIGRTVRVAVERALPGGDAEGVSERYLRVRLRGPLPPGARHREIVTARVLGLEDDGLVAEPVGPQVGAAG
ncbi:MAG: radical SAM protein, partial [Acidobacteria bacterium]|nr:radical SAM protein [Acidobacteriota bacterium]